MLAFFFRDKKEIECNSKFKNCELSDSNVPPRYIEKVHLIFNLEAGLLLPFVLKYNLIT